MNARLKFSDHIKLIKNIRTSGTITPSSNALINSLTSPIDFSKARCLVELGPGNGCITRSLLARMHADCVLISLEVNNDFVAQLNALNDPRLKVYNACASSIPTILEELGIDRVDHVVSSLPLAIIEKDVVAAILENVSENLREGTIVGCTQLPAHRIDCETQRLSLRIQFIDKLFGAKRKVVFNSRQAFYAF